MNTPAFSKAQASAYGRRHFNLSDDLFPELHPSCKAPVLPMPDPEKKRTLPIVIGNENAQVCFYCPEPRTVIGRVLDALLRGVTLTQDDARRQFASSRLATEVNELEDQGWTIDTEMIEVQTRDAGCVAYVDRYLMNRDNSEVAGGAGQAYAEAARLVEISRRST